MSLVVLENVSKTREKGGTAFTLSIPRFEAKKGEFVGVVGPSGCGKSTFLDMLGLVLKSDRAELFRFVTEEGEAFEVAKLSDAILADIRRRYIGYILQSGGLLPFLTVEENIMLSAALSGREVSGRDFESLTHKLGIASQRHKKPQFLSGGQRQRVAIARAMIHSPVLILADEPTASVDHPTAIEIVERFHAVAKEQGRTVVMVTHDTQMATRYSDRLYTFRLRKPKENHTIATMVTDNENEKR